MVFCIDITVMAALGYSNEELSGIIFGSIRGTAGI
jgi:hypothetical protein